MANQRKERNVEKYIQWVSTLSLTLRIYLHSFSCCCLYDICEIPRNSLKILTYSSSRSSKVIDLGVNRKLICNFLLVINSNQGRISYRFRDIDASYAFSCRLSIGHEPLNRLVSDIFSIKLSTDIQTDNLKSIIDCISLTESLFRSGSPTRMHDRQLGARPWAFQVKTSPRKTAARVQDQPM